MSLVPLAVLVGCAIAATADAVRWRGVPIALAIAIAAPIALRSRHLDLCTDRRGIAFAHDLFRSVPDGALVLTSGDAYVQASMFVCAVEKSCQDRVLVAPGMLFLAWQRAALARRPEGRWVSGVTSVQEAHRIVERAIGERPVYVLPSLLAKDPEILARFRVAPDLLYYRVYPSAEAEAADRGRLVAQLDEVLSGRGCEGCAMGRADLAQSFELVMVLAYEAALRNSAVWARTTLGDARRAEALERLIER